MYAERELIRLNAVKSVVRRRIARRRSQVSAQAARVTQPLKWIDRAYVYWRKAGPIAKLAAAPISVWLMNKLFARRKMAGPVMRWGPLIWNIVRGFSAGSSGRRPS